MAQGVSGPFPGDPTYPSQVPFANARVPESVRGKLLAALALQKAAADSSQPVYSKGLGFAKMGAGLVGGLMEGYTTAKEEAAQSANRQLESQTLARILEQRAASRGVGLDSSGGGSGAASSAGAPAPQPGAAGGPSSYFGRVAQIESGGNPNGPASPTSSASGLYQFTDGTWNGLAKQYPNLGLTPDGRGDPGQQQRAMAALTNDNASALGRAGLQPTPANLYAAHFLGAGGATGLLKADPNAPVAAILGPQVVAANPQLKGMTAGQLIGSLNSKMAGVDPSTIPGAAPSSSPQMDGGSQPAPPVSFGGQQQAATPAPVALNPDAPAPGASPTGSTSLPPGVTPDMINGDPQASAGSDAPSIRASLEAAMNQDPASGAVATPSATGAAASYQLSPQTMTSNPPSAAAGGLGAAPAVGTLPGADAPLPGDIPTAANMVPPNAIPNAAPSLRDTIEAAADPSSSGTGSTFPQTGPMPPPGAQSRALMAQQPAGAAPLPSHAQPTLAAAQASLDQQNGSTAPAGGMPPDASSFAPQSSPMSTAPAQQAISGATQAPAAGTSATPPGPRGALIQAMMSARQGGNDPSSAQAFNRDQGAAGAPSLVQVLMQQQQQQGQPPAAAPPRITPLMRVIAQQKGIALPPDGQDGAGPGQQSGGTPAQANGAPGPGGPHESIGAMYSRLAADPRTDPAFLAKIADMMTPQYRTEKMDNGDLVRLDDRNIVPPQVVYRGGVKPDWHFDPATGTASNSTTGEVRRGAPPAAFTSSMKLNGVDIPILVTPDANGGQPKVTPLLPDGGQSGGPSGQAPSRPVSFGGTPEGAAPAPAAPSQPAPSPFGPKVQSYLDASNKQAQAQETAKVTAKNDADQIGESRTKLESLRQGATDINQAGQALASFKGQMPTGPLGETAMKLRGLANTFGLGDPAQLANMEIFAKNATKAATAQIKDVTNRATNLDMEIELKNNPGINVSDQTNRILIDHLARANALAQSYEQAKQAYYDQNGSLSGFQPQWQASLSGASATPLSKFPMDTKTVNGQPYVKLLSTDPKGYSWHPAGEVQ